MGHTPEIYSVYRGQLEGMGPGRDRTRCLWVRRLRRRRRAVHGEAVCAIDEERRFSTGVLGYSSDMGAYDSETGFRNGSLAQRNPRAYFITFGVIYGAPMDCVKTF